MGLSKETFLRPPFIALAYLGLTGAASAGIRAPRVVLKPYNLIGLGIVVLGLALIVWSFRIFHRRGTTHDPYGEPTALVAEGPFALTRNPMYVGVSAVLLGVAVLIGTVPVFLAPLLFLATMHVYFVPLEESRMERLLGSEYLEYKKRVRRWL
jgi:protein-S-isoprenylcysteine O-methyltransferase Ste14